MVCSLLTLMGIAVASQVFRVQTMYCFVEFANCSPEVTAIIRELKGQRLLFYDAEAALADRLQSLPTVKVRAVSKQLPDTLTVILEPQQVEYVLQDQQTQQTVVIAEGGVALESAAHPEWPLLFIESSLISGIKLAGRIDPVHHQDLRAALQALPSLNWPIKTIYIPNWQTVQIEVDNQPSVLFELRTLSNQVQRAKDIYSHLPAEEFSRVKEIDVRYKLPVLRETPSITRHDSL